MSKLEGCIVEGPAKKSESAENKGDLGLNINQYDVPKWSPSSRVIDVPLNLCFSLCFVL